MSIGEVMKLELQAYNTPQILLGLRVLGAVTLPLSPIFIIRTGKVGKFYTISETASAYDELLLTIDNLRGIAALRKGDWKLIKGEKNSTQ
jgi:hypothetical protein